MQHLQVQLKLFKHLLVSYNKKNLGFQHFYLATYINITEQPARYRGWSLYFPDTGIYY